MRLTAYRLNRPELESAHPASGLPSPGSDRSRDAGLPLVGLEVAAQPVARDSPVVADGGHGDAEVASDFLAMFEELTP